MNFATKKQCRQYFRKLRATHPQAPLCTSGLQRICAAPFYANAQHIAFYLANDSELNLQNLIEISLQLGKNCYLPYVNFATDSLEFYRYTAHSPLQQNRFGIYEPIANPNHQLMPTQLNCVFLPLVAIDKTGRRLGMGGGYYDKAFAFTQQNKSAHTPFLIGAGFACQLCDTLVHDPWDISLDAFVDEQQLLLFGKP